MADNLVIVESPGKVKSIGKFLGKGYQVLASVGHVRDLPKSQIGVDVNNGFEPKYITIRGKGEVIFKLKKEAKNAGKVYLATDPDREGEAISWHLANLLNIEQNDKCRITFNEITKNAVKNAIKSPREIDMNLVDAQQARRVLDRIVGYKISPLLWRKVRKGLSAGRVQSVATRLVCDREEEIVNFKPEEYWTLIAELTRKKSKTVFKAKFFGSNTGHDETKAEKSDPDMENSILKTGNAEQKTEKNDSKNGKIELKNEEQVKKIIREIGNNDFIVNKIKKSEKRKTPAPPFITSTLQQEAARKLGFTTKRTMSVAQQLYEGLDVKAAGTVGLITYMRTDSTRVSSEAQQEARSYIRQRYGEKYLPEEIRNFRNKSASQDAHEAVRPTHINMNPESLKDSLNSEQYKLYKLIWERFTASQMAAAIYDTVAVDIIAAGYLFKATGSKMKFPGFISVYVEGRDEESEEDELNIPELEEGEKVDLKKLLPEQHFTQPPLRFTEATLVKALEEKGIGRPSTYAPTITTILTRGYVDREKKFLFPTELGKIVTDIMKKHFTEIVDIQFTAQMEEKLDNIEEGSVEWVDVMKEFYSGFVDVLKSAEQHIEQVDVPDEVSSEKCEKCGRNMVIKNGKFGKFLACPGFPECRNTRPILEEAGVSCPKCGAKVLVRKTRKGRKYLSCENNPECGFMTWDMPAQEKCPKCGNFLTRKYSGKNVILKCSKEDCGYSQKAARS